MKPHPGILKQLDPPIIKAVIPNLRGVELSEKGKIWLRFPLHEMSIGEARNLAAWLLWKSCPHDERESIILAYLASIKSLLNVGCNIGESQST